MRTSEPVTSPVFITRWATTQGILRVDPREGMSVSTDGYLYVPGRYGGTSFRNTDWASTEEEAQKQAVKKLHRKIAAAERALDKLRRQVGVPFPIEMMTSL